MHSRLGMFGRSVDREQAEGGWADVDDYARGASERVSRKFTECMADSSQETKACEVSVERLWSARPRGFRCDRQLCFVP